MSTTPNHKKLVFKMKILNWGKKILVVNLRVVNFKLIPLTIVEFLTADNPD